MRPPCEIATKEFIPLFRYYLTHELRKRGFKQTQISKLLGITQAAVSGYLSKRIKGNRDIEEFIIGRIGTIVEDLLSHYSASKLIYHTCSLCYELRAGGGICVLHKKAIPELESENCSICEESPFNQTDAFGERVSALNHMKNAISLLQSQDGVGYLVPEVMMNIVYALKDAKTTQDVVAIPGRIVKIKSKIKPSANPAFGGSEHMSKLIIRIMKYLPDARSMICVDSNETIQQAVKSVGIPFFICDNIPDKTEEEIIEKCLMKHESELQNPFAILVPEAPGRESLIYIVDKLPEYISQQIIKIIKEMRKIKE